MLKMKKQKYYYTIENRTYDELIAEFNDYKKALAYWKKEAKEEIYCSIGLYKNNINDEEDRDLIKASNL